MRMANYDLLGNICIVKFKLGVNAGRKKKWALALLRKNKQVTSILEKVGGFSGKLRKQKTRYLAGEKTKEALYRENGCLFRFNVDTCYFSPRLAEERKEIASIVRKGEKVLIMFGGVAPFAVVIGKLAKPSKIISIELNKACKRYAEENIKRNKVNVELVWGDVNAKLPRLKDKFDRIIMARPNIEESFLPIALKKIKKNGIIHYYGFCREDELESMRFMILTEAGEAGNKIKILKVKKAGDIGTRKFRYRVDIKVLN